MPSETPKIKSVNIKFEAPQGSRFTAQKFAVESGLRAFYIDGVEDANERKKREEGMYRMIFEIIKIFLKSHIIEYSGVDTLAQHNGTRGKPPRVYKVLLKKGISIEWVMEA